MLDSDSGKLFYQFSDIYTESIMKSMAESAFDELDSYIGQKRKF